MLLADHLVLELVLASHFSCILSIDLICNHVHCFPLHLRSFTSSLPEKAARLEPLMDVLERDGYFDEVTTETETSPLSAPSPSTSASQQCTAPPRDDSVRGMVFVVRFLL